MSNGIKAKGIFGVKQAIKLFNGRAKPDTSKTIHSFKQIDYSTTICDRILLSVYKIINKDAYKNYSTKVERQNTKYVIEATKVVHVISTELNSFSLNRYRAMNHQSYQPDEKIILYKSDEYKYEIIFNTKKKQVAIMSTSIFQCYKCYEKFEISACFDDYENVQKTKINNYFAANAMAG